MLTHSRTADALRLGTALVLALGAPNLASAQIVLPGDVIVVAESVGAQDTLQVYDGCSGALKHSFTDPRWRSSGAGRSVAVAPNGTIWVSDLVTSWLFQYDPNLQPLASWPVTCGAQPGGFAFDPVGRLFGVTYQPWQVYSMDPATGATTSCASLLFPPWGLDVLPDGNVCVSDHPSTAIRVVDPNTGSVLRTLSCGGGLVGGSYSLCARPTGHVFVNDSFAPQIVDIDANLPTGSPCSCAIPLAANPYPFAIGLDINEDLDRLYVAVLRAGTYWLEQYDVSSPSCSLISATDMNASVDIPFPSPHSLALVRGSACGGTLFCFGDGSGTICPCGNHSLPGRDSGCLNSLGVGASLRAAGSASVGSDTLALTARSMPGNSPVLYFQGNAQSNGGFGAGLGDGLQCVATGIVRLARLANDVFGTSALPSPGGSPISVLGQVPATGGTRHYQAWYRNAADYCTPQTFNLTNGVTIHWAP